VTYVLFTTYYSQRSVAYTLAANLIAGRKQRSFASTTAFPIQRFVITQIGNFLLGKAPLAHSLQIQHLKSVEKFLQQHFRIY